MKRYVIAFFLLMGFFLLSTVNAVAGTKRDWLAEYKDDIAKIEEYINSMTSVSGKFQQYASKGGSISGNFYISRPGKMRLDYDFPVQYRLIANDNVLVYYDKKLDQTNYLDMKNIPVSLLLSPKVSFASLGMDITKIEKDNNSVAITIKPRGNGFGGYATIVFDMYPVRLKKWSIVDAQNIRADVVFESFNTSIVFSEDFFKFDKPKSKKRKIKKTDDETL